MAKVAIIGGSGYLGTQLIVGLLQRGYHTDDIVNIDILPPANPSPVEHRTCNILDQNAIVAVLHDVSYVFHTVSIVDLSPCPTPLVYDLNVAGVDAVIAACKVNNVLGLIYTSSMDVVFDGQPVRNGKEDMPVAVDSTYNGYIKSKALAETAVLNVNSEHFTTTSLRPAHIYGPGDEMIRLILHEAAKGNLPAAFGSGVQDYVYIENCVSGHLDCLIAMQKAPSQVGGQAFFLSDSPMPVWDHMAPFMAAAGLAVPSIQLPTWLMLIIAYPVELLCWLLWNLAAISWQPNVTRYTVLAIGQDYYFDASKARSVFWTTPLIDRESATAVTVAWVESESWSLPETRSPALQQLHTIHLLYGCVFLCLGAFGFAYPHVWSESMGVACDPLPSPDAVIAQTAGLIIFVLGSYSVVASLWRWPVIYFQMTFLPKLLTAGLYIFQIYRHQIPPSFLLLASVELFIGLITWVLVAQTHPEPIKYFYNGLTAAQLAHGVASGAFALLLALAPEFALPSLLGDVTLQPGSAALVFGYVMGAAETTMTIAYSTSGYVEGMQRFAWLSVVSRYSALATLWVGLLFNHCAIQQALGVAPDAILATLTLMVLRSQQVQAWKSKQA
eukprot:m.151120 g.151120  ORF g.151120 m.151120 type:complete len:612 (-) comp16330_c0_seq2:34-1869(-)